VSIRAERTSEEPYRRLYENAPCGLLSTSHGDEIVAVNETLLEWLGLGRADIIGMKFNDLQTVGSQLFYETRYQPVLQLQGEVREVSLTLRRSDGSSMPVLVNAVVDEATDESPRTVRAAIFDSTSRQDYERALLDARRSAESSESRVRVLQDASIAFASAGSEAELAAVMVRIAREAFSAGSAAVLLLDDDGQLRLTGGRHPFQDVLAAGDARPETRAIADGEPLTLTASLGELDDFPVVATALADARIQTLSIVPIPGDERPDGVLVCFFGRARSFDSHDLELQAALARQFCQTLTRIRLRDELERLALYDRLTGLANRALLQERLATSLANAAKSGSVMSVIFLDLDGFKPVNDLLGHAIGDSVLQQVSGRIADVVRRDDLVGRFGGDEFVVVCDDATEPVARAIAARIAATVAAPLASIGEEVSITASIGIAVYQPSERNSDVSSSDDVLALADAAMYRSKKSGRRGVITADFV
jgi:diguanylate cyclase (GGDEF)-like protein/PAS domain S-box-containing protein